MPELALHPTDTRETATALFVEAAGVQAMFAKLSTRAAHYGELSLARGKDWAVLFNEGNTGSVNLPWLQTDPLYLYQLAPHCLCEVGYRPNIPAPLIRTFIAQIQETYSIPGSFAFLSDHSSPKLLDLSRARLISSTDMAALR